MLLDAISKRSAEFYFKSGTNPTCVILSPNNKRYLEERHKVNFGIEIGGEFKLFDLEVLVSSDISENDFKVGF